MKTPTLWKRYGHEITSGPRYDPVSYRITIEVFDGAIFEQAGQKHGMTKQAASKRFWLSVVNRPFKSIFGENETNLDTLRKKWSEFND